MILPCASLVTMVMEPSLLAISLVVVVEDEEDDADEEDVSLLLLVLLVPYRLSSALPPRLEMDEDMWRFP